MLAAHKPVIGVQVVPNQALAYRAAREAGCLVFETVDAEAIALAAVAALNNGGTVSAGAFPIEPGGLERSADAVLGRMR